MGVLFIEMVILLFRLSENQILNPVRRIAQAILLFQTSHSISMQIFLLLQKSFLLYDAGYILHHGKPTGILLVPVHRARHHWDFHKRYDHLLPIHEPHVTLPLS